MKTTLNQIRKYSPCKEGYRKLLKFLGKTEADDEPLALSTILESNGLDDAIWCFRAVSGFDKEKRLFAVFCARQVQHLLDDPRSIAAINVSERYANGNATDTELTAAHDAAYDATRASNAASNAASNSTYAAYSDAVYAASNADSSAYAAYSDADPEIKPVLESYLKNLLTEEK